MYCLIILSQIAQYCGFLLVEHTSLMLKLSNSHWKFFLMNSLLQSCRCHTGQGYQQSQLWVNLSRMCSAVSLWIWISLPKVKTLSIQVNALDSTCQPLTLTFHGFNKLATLKILLPIRGLDSMVTSSQGAIGTSYSGRQPSPRPANLYFLYIFALQFINLLLKLGMMMTLVQCLT